MSYYQLRPQGHLKKGVGCHPLLLNIFKLCCHFSWEVVGIPQDKTFSGPVGSFTVKENHISSAMSKIFRYTQQTSCYFYIRFLGGLTISRCFCRGFRGVIYPQCMARSLRINHCPKQNQFFSSNQPFKQLYQGYM